MNASKSEKTAVNSFYWGAALYLIVAVLPLFIALAARQLYPEWLSGEIQQLLPRVVLAHSPFWVQVLFFGALLSAIFSTCSGALLAPASILTENIVKPLWSKKLSDKKLLLLLRLSVFVMATLSTLMALRRSNIYELVGESSVLGLVTLLVPMFSAVYLPSATTRGAYFSMLAGGIGWWYFTYLQPMAVPALIPGLLLSMAGMWLGNRLSGRLPAF